MSKLINIIGIAMFFILGLFSLGFSQESLTITTYYPSPYGSYNALSIYDNLTFKDSNAPPQDLTLRIDNSGNLILSITNPNPVEPVQLLFNDSGTTRPFCYLLSYSGGSGTTYCADGYVAVNFLKTDKTPANPDSLPSDGYMVCLRGYD